MSDLVSSFHLGMERVGFEYNREFSWLDGANVGDTYNNFADGEPNNFNVPESCEVFYTSTGLFYTSTGFWKSEQCTARPYVCQRGLLFY